MTHLHNEELRLELFHLLALLHDGGDHLVGSLFSHHHLFLLFCLSKDVVSLQGLTLVRDHVAVKTCLLSVASGLHHHCHKLRHFVAFWVLDQVLLLVPGYLPHFLGSQEDVLVERSEDPTHFLQTQSCCNHINLGLVFVFQSLNSSHLSDLGRLVNGFNVDSDSLRVVGVF